jgi:hypothetical protein
VAGQHRGEVRTIQRRLFFEDADTLMIFLASSLQGNSHKVFNAEHSGCRQRGQALIVCYLPGSTSVNVERGRRRDGAGVFKRALVNSIQ